MLVNYSDDKVKFVSYTGRYPNLCNGILTLQIDGEEVKFGHDYRNFDFVKKIYTDRNYGKFWTSGGSCGFLHDYEESYTNNGEWIIDGDLIPRKYRKYASKIDQVFNDNVPWGCCGGCL